MAVQVFNLGQRVSLPPCSIALLLTIEKLIVYGLEPLAFSSSRLSPRSMNTRGVIHRGQSILNVPTVIPADDAILERILETTYSTSHQGLSRSAFTKLDAALFDTAARLLDVLSLVLRQFACAFGLDATVFHRSFGHLSLPHCTEKPPDDNGLYVSAPHNDDRWPGACLSG